MNRFTIVSFALVLGLCIATAGREPNSHHFPRLWKQWTQRIATQHRSLVCEGTSIVQVQREADDLARTAQTIPSDVASVRKGMLPKDAIEMLKQIEKLSKELRAQLNP